MPNYTWVSSSSVTGTADTGEMYVYDEAVPVSSVRFSWDGEKLISFPEIEKCANCNPMCAECLKDVRKSLLF